MKVKPTKTIKVSDQAHYKLKVMAAREQITVYELIDRLVKEMKPINGGKRAQ